MLRLSCLDFVMMYATGWDSINFYQHDSQKKTQRMLHDKVRWIWFIVYNIIEHYSHKLQSTRYELRTQSKCFIMCPYFSDHDDKSLVHAS